MKLFDGRETEGALQLRVLIVDDDPSICEALGIALHANGIATQSAGSGAEAAEKMGAFAPHVALIDLGLPDTNGIELIKWLKERYACGMIIVTGNDAEAERIIGLEIGADDYINKPPALRELVARIRAVHRRVGNPTVAPVRASESTPAEPRGRQQISIGAMSVDMDLRRITDMAGRNVTVTAAEFSALEMLVQAEGDAVSREAISQQVLRRPWQAEDRSVDQIIFQLRSKLVPHDKDHLVIQTVRGAGYRLVLPAR